MISRVANSIYWMSRYLERAENVARFIQVNLNLMLDLGEAPNEGQWEPIVRTSGDEVDFKARYGEYSEENVIKFLTFDKKNPNSILTCLEYCRDNAKAVRDTISSEMWEELNKLHHTVQKYGRKRKAIDLQELYAKIKNASHLIIGLSYSAMSKGEGWHFSKMGRFIERAEKTARLIDVKYFMLLPDIDYVDTPFDSVQWIALLKSVSAFEMYKKKFHRINNKNVAQYLIFDNEFPRSCNFCLKEVLSSLESIIGYNNNPGKALEEMNKLNDMLENNNIESILLNGLHEFIDVFQFNLNIVDNAIYETYFELKPIK